MQCLQDEHWPVCSPCDVCSHSRRWRDWWRRGPSGLPSHRLHTGAPQVGRPGVWCEASRRTWRRRVCWPPPSPDCRAGGISRGRKASNTLQRTVDLFYQKFRSLLWLPEAAPGFLQKTQIVCFVSATSFWKTISLTWLTDRFTKLNLTCSLVFPTTLFLLVMLLANFIQNWWAWIWELSPPKYVKLLFPTFVQSKHFNPLCGCGAPGNMTDKLKIKFLTKTVCSGALEWCGASEEIQL